MLDLKKWCDRSELEIKHDYFKKNFLIKKAELYHVKKAYAFYEQQTDDEIKKLKSKIKRLERKTK